MEIFNYVVDIAEIVTLPVVVGGFIWGIYLWARGILPAIIRLGNGLARRKIAIFAKGDNLTSLKSLLTDSKLFNEKNICEINKTSDIGRAELEQTSVYLVYWDDWKSGYKEILNQKKDGCALIIYTPPSSIRIPVEAMEELELKRNTAVTNFRGRLLNDIVTAMITTGYERK